MIERDLHGSPLLSREVVNWSVIFSSAIFSIKRHFCCSVLRIVNHRFPRIFRITSPRKVQICSAVLSADKPILFSMRRTILSVISATFIGVILTPFFPTSGSFFSVLFITFPALLSAPLRVFFAVAASSVTMLYLTLLASRGQFGFGSVFEEKFCSSGVANGALGAGSLLHVEVGV